MGTNGLLLVTEWPLLGKKSTGPEYTAPDGQGEWPCRSYRSLMICCLTGGCRVRSETD